ncbi:hypothetical protein [Yoonia sp. BS5-3]|uniref:DUF465 domain-containing protein n=1 Tax=Yoonia phaeophyticola TaxID=3137369 RepID=A0ABZ2V4R3_9RHOB
MVRKLHPADELALIHEDLRRLKAREAFLRNGFLRDKLPKRGSDALVEVKTLRSRVLRQDKLPDAIRDDPQYWEERRLTQVQVRNL